MLRLITSAFLAIVANAAAQTCLGGCPQSALAFAYQVCNKRPFLFPGKIVLGAVVLGM